MWIQLPLPAEKGHTHPIHFLAHVLWTNGWMDEDAVWYGSRPRPRRYCTRRGPSYRERGTTAPLFSAHVYCGHGRPSQLLLSSCTNGRPKTAEPIDLSLGLWARVSRRKHKLHRILQAAPICPYGRAYVTWRILLNRPSAAAMRSYVNLLWTICWLLISPQR